MSHDEELVRSEAENTEHLPDFTRFKELLGKLSNRYTQFRFPGVPTPEENIDNNEMEQEQESPSLLKTKC